MKTNVKEFFEKKPVPDFIKSHKVWKKVEYIDKVYPRLGLPNSIEEVSVDFSGSVALEYFIRCAEEVEFDCDVAIKFLTNRSSYDDIAKLVEFKKHLEHLTQQNRESGVASEISNLKDNVFYNNKLSIFENYTNLRKYLMLRYSGMSMQRLAVDDIYYRVRPITDFPAYYWYDDAKSKGTKTKPNIAFSSDGVEGLWDILTMSMRGFRSCQSWDGQHRNKLIGSLIDPYVGIIYLSSNIDTEYGKQFIYRCLVRFVVNAETNKPHLFLEKMYPEYNKVVASLFKNYLSEKLKGKFEVQDWTNKQDYLPVFSSFTHLNEDTFSYRDSKLPYGKIPSEKDSKVYTNIAAKNTRIVSICKNAAFVAFSELLPTYHNDHVNELIRTPSGRYLIRDFFDKTISRYVASFVNEHHATITTSKKYGRDLIYSLLKTNILYADIKNLRGNIDRYFGWNKGIKNKELKALLDPVIQEMRRVLKQEYRHQFVPPKSLNQMSETLPEQV